MFRKNPFVGGGVSDAPCRYPDSEKRAVEDAGPYKAEAEQARAEAEALRKKLDAKMILVEMHAEATSEKLAMGLHLDGKVGAVFGTHTHVPTADLQILPKGTGYVTDLGMSGPRNSVLGVKPEISIARFRGELTGRYEPAPGPCKLEGAIFTIDSDTGLCTATERVFVYD